MFPNVQKEVSCIIEVFFSVIYIQNYVLISDFLFV